MLRFFAGAVAAIALTSPAFAEDPPTTAAEQWAKDRHAAIVLEACNKVWAAGGEAQLDQLLAQSDTDNDAAEKALGAKLEELRVKSIDAEEEYKKLQGQGSQKADVSKKIADKLKEDWERLWRMSELMPAVRESTAKCIKDQRAYVRGEGPKPGTLFQPINVAKDVQGHWSVSCQDPADDKTKTYNGSFVFTIAPGDLGGNKLKGTFKGSPVGDLELTGFLWTENSAMNATTPNPTGSGPTAFMLSGKVEKRDAANPEAAGTIQAIVNNVYGCSGKFSP
jgi:hypothetical protein